MFSICCADCGEEIAQSTQELGKIVKDTIYCVSCAEIHRSVVEEEELADEEDEEAEDVQEEEDGK